MDEDLTLSYALSKQLDSAYALETRFGSLQLDEDMRKAVVAALRPLLKKQLDHKRKRDLNRISSEKSPLTR